MSDQADFGIETRRKLQAIGNPVDGWGKKLLRKTRLEREKLALAGIWMFSCKGCFLDRLKT